MTRWRPRRDWFAEHAPRVLAAGERAAAIEALVPVMARNFER
jgi:GST-like protein